MQALSYLNLNMAAPNAALVCYAVQNDRLSRYVVADLADGEQALVPESGTLYAIRYRKPDGTGGFYDTLEDGTPAVVADGSRLTIGYAQQVLTVPGDVYVQLQLFNASGEILTSFAWQLRVFETVWSDSQIESSDYYSVLSQQIADVLGAAEALTGMTATASALPAGSAPTVNVTGGTDGQPYNLALGIPAGPQGAPGTPGSTPTMSSTEVQYQAGTSGTTPPTGTWLSSPPDVQPGGYLWTRARARFDSTWTSYWYSVSYRGQNGAGSASDATPLPDVANGAAGTSSDFSRADHQHPISMIPSEGGDGYVKLYDGTMIQWGSFTKQISSGNAYADTVVTYPVPFVEGSDVHVFISTDEPTTSATSQNNVCIPTVFRIDATLRLTRFTARVWKQASIGTANNATPTCSWFAVGRWK